MYVGQCAQYCGTQHAKMLLRVYVESPEQFSQWIVAEKQPARSADAVAAGRQIFEKTACINCHAVSGTIADGRFGPDLTHLMSREPGSLMPAMNLSVQELEAVTAYLESLR